MSDFAVDEVAMTIAREIARKALEGDYDILLAARDIYDLRHRLPTIPGTTLDDIVDIARQKWTSCPWQRTSTGQLMRFRAKDVLAADYRNNVRTIPRTGFARAYEDTRRSCSASEVREIASERRLTRRSCDCYRGRLISRVSAGGPAGDSLAASHFPTFERWLACRLRTGSLSYRARWRSTSRRRVADFQRRHVSSLCSVESPGGPGRDIHTTLYRGV